MAQNIPLPSIRPVCGGTKVIGVFGHPVTHSLSPAMHNAALAALELPYIYVPFPVAPAGLEPALRALPALGVVGVNLTIPHKEAALPLMDETTQEARDVGAVNTVHCLDGRLIGDNTDGYGFFEPLRQQQIEMRGRVALVLGAGGAARAVAFRLAREGVQVRLVNRTHERAERLARAIAEAGLPRQVQVIEWRDETLAANLRAADMLVNTTRIGMVSNHSGPEPIQEYSVQSPVAEQWLHPDLLVYDLVYNPVETELLRRARARGCRTLNGVKMLVWQGAAAFQRWTGHWPPTDVMENAVVEGLNAR